MPTDFRAFLAGLPGRYCIECLSRFYEQTTAVIRDYLRANEIAGRVAECANCGKQTETFRSRPIAPD
jgi:hypothetical protein